ncbi:hypothetical protein BDV41DRAFT_520988 [Aspergillus transmontanensis]|uniref:Uncharacterized protein n=1 Tax=Aspergillus transmontanensis TaxID=1034304 RepID=A0A5N6WF17_9EURO|nr:hypothetical protein BDV41DRAFT_520988 [Aspergillus transmontanensis]
MVPQASINKHHTSGFPNYLSSNERNINRNWAAPICGRGRSTSCFPTDVVHDILSRLKVAETAPKYGPLGFEKLRYPTLRPQWPLRRSRIVTGILGAAPRYDSFRMSSVQPVQSRLKGLVESGKDTDALKCIARRDGFIVTQVLLTSKVVDLLHNRERHRSNSGQWCPMSQCSPGWSELYPPRESA